MKNYTPTIEFYKKAISTYNNGKGDARAALMYLRISLESLLYILFRDRTQVYKEKNLASNINLLNNIPKDSLKYEADTVKDHSNEAVHFSIENDLADKDFSISYYSALNSIKEIFSKLKIKIPSELMEPKDSSIIIHKDSIQRSESELIIFPDKTEDADAYSIDILNHLKYYRNKIEKNYYATIKASKYNKFDTINCMEIAVKLNRKRMKKVKFPGLAVTFIFNGDDRYKERDNVYELINKDLGHLIDLNWNFVKNAEDENSVNSERAKLILFKPQLFNVQIGKFKDQDNYLKDFKNELEQILDFTFKMEEDLQKLKNKDI